MSDVDCINCKYNSHDRDKLPCVLCDDSSNWEYRGAPENGVSQGSSRRVEHLKQDRDEAITENEKLRNFLEECDISGILRSLSCYVDDTTLKAVLFERANELDDLLGENEDDR